MGSRGTGALVAVLAIGGTVADARPDPLPLEVAVCNTAAIPAGILASAEGQAAALIADAGIVVRWLPCSDAHLTEPADTTEVPACRRPRRPSTIVLDVLDRPPAAANLGRAGGFARVPRDGRPGQCSGVFYGHVADRTRAAGQRAHLLALLAVHEVAHLLLGSTEHAASGLMRGEWSSGDLALARRGRLRFQPWEARALRTAIQARQPPAEMAAGGASRP